MNHMLSLTDLKRYYIKLYEEVRNYIWDFNTVKHLADLEISVFRRFPLMSEVRANFNQFQACISRIRQEDEDLDQAAKDFNDLINSTDDIYSMIIQPKEA